MKNEPVMGFMNKFFRYVPDELQFSLKGSFGTGRGQSETGRYAEDMGVNGHVRLLVDHRGDHVSGFAAHAG